MARVQDNIATANGTTSPSCSFATLPGAGSTIVVAWASWVGSGTPTHNSVSDNQGGSYTQIGSTVSFNSGTGSDLCRISMWKRDNIGAPSGTFTVTGTANLSVDSRFVVIEYGSVLTSTLDQNGSDTNASGTAASIALSTTTNADDIIVGAVSVGSGSASVTLNPDDVELPTVIRENLDDSASQSINVSERLVGETGSYTPAWVTTSGPSGAIAAALKLSQWDGPYFWAAGTPAFTATNGATLAPGLPTGWAADDIHVLIAHRSDNTAMTSLSPNWINISADNNTAAQRVEVWVRRAVGGDAAPTVTFGSGTTVRGARIIGVRGVDTGLDLSTLELSRSNNAASATITFATLTPTPANTLLLALYAYEDDPTAASNISSAWQGFIPATSSLGNDAAIGFAYRQWPSASSATGGLTSTASGGTFANSPNVGILLALPAASTGVTGTGAITIGAPALAASGTFTTTGTGALSIAAPALAGSGTAFDPPITGTGELAIGAPAVAGSGTFAVTGTGAVSIATPALDAAGTFATTGTGAVSVAAPALEASGTFTTTGAGALAISAPALDGTGTYTPEPITGTGALSIAAPALAASGFFGTDGTGALTIGAPALAASGTFTPGEITGTGDTAIGAPAIAADGTFTTVGTGALSVGPPQIASSGSFATTGAGAASIAAPAVAGTGTFTLATITGTVEITISAPGLAGTGTLEYVGTGAITIGPPSLSGYSILATRAAASDSAYTGATASDAAYLGAGAGDLVLVGATSSDSEV